MFYLLIAASSLSLIILIYKKNAPLLEAKKNIDWTPTQKDTSPHEEELPSEDILQKPLNFASMNRAYRVADVHFSRGNFAEAEKHFIKVLSYNEFHPEALNRLGVIYVQQDDHRRAELIFKKLLTISPKEAAYHCNYGRCLYNQQRFNEAIEAYSMAMNLDPKKPARYVSVGQIYYELKEYAKALEHFLKALELSPQNMEYLHIVADLAELNGDIARQKTILKKILDLDPYNEETRTKFDKISLTQTD